MDLSKLNSAALKMLTVTNNVQKYEKCLLVRDTNTVSCRCFHSNRNRFNRRELCLLSTNKMVLTYEKSERCNTPRKLNGRKILPKMQ